MGLKQRDNFEFRINRINTAKSHTLLDVKCQKHVHPDLTDLEDTFYTGPCTDMNADVSQSCNTIKTLTSHTVQEIGCTRAIIHISTYNDT